MRSLAGFLALVFIVGILVTTDAAPPKNNAAPNLGKVDADVLPSGTFAGVLVSVPDSDRMFTLKITYPEVRLKPGAKMPNLRSMEGRTMQQIMQEMQRAQQMPPIRGGYHQANALSNMMRMEQRYEQSQQRMAQTLARAQQQEVQLLQREIQAIRNMYQVVSVTRDFDFQADEHVKVRIKDLPDQFDEKGNIKRYTVAEKSELKGKDKNLMGYESSLEALKPGQTVLVALRTHKKTKPTALTTAVAKKDKEDVQEDDFALQHKMQVKVIVIWKDGNAPQSTPAAPKKNKK